MLRKGREINKNKKSEKRKIEYSTNGMLNGGRKAMTAVGQCENKFRYQKLLNCLAHAKCLLMSCMFTDNLIYRYCHAMHTHTHTHTERHTHIDTNKHYTLNVAAT